MTKQRSAASLCFLAAVLAVASVGPWESGPLGYSGVSTEGGILTIIAAGAVALAGWWWFTSERRLAWGVVLAIAILCIGVAAYSIIDIRDFYLDSGDDWFERIGWGLIVTFAASLLLLVLSILVLWKTSSGKGGLSSWPMLVLLGVVCLFGSALWIVGAADNHASRLELSRSADEGDHPAIPTYAVRAIAASTNGTTWGIWLFGDGRNNCWATKTGERFAYEEANCGFNVPPNYWQLAARGSVDSDGEGRSSLLFFLTRPDVGYLSVLTGGKRLSGTGMVWTRVRLRSVGKRQARQARLKQNFRYGAIKVLNPACIRRVKVFGKSGERARETKLFPCITPLSPSPLEEQ